MRTISPSLTFRSPLCACGKRAFSPHATIALNDCGAIPFYSDFRVIDLNTGTLRFQNPTVTNLNTTDLRIKKNTVYHSSGKKLIIF